MKGLARFLEGYAARGVFRGFSEGPMRGGKATFKMLWHRDRFFELVVDPAKHTLQFPVVLPKVPPRSSMYREYKQFVESLHSKERPEHRRINTRKAHARCANRGGNIAVTLTVKDGDYEYGARRLIHLVHETYLAFLYDGRYYEYLVETFDLDPDRM